jgi:hypothetical protein
MNFLIKRQEALCIKLKLFWHKFIFFNFEIVTTCEICHRSYEVCCLYGFFFYHILSYSFGYIFYNFMYGCIFYVLLFNCVNCVLFCYVNVFFLLYMFCSVYSVSLCCSVYCLCVNVYCTILYCTTATGCQSNCSQQNISYAVDKKLLL